MNLNGRTITGIQVAGIDTKDAPEFCDAYVESAVWGDTGDHLTEDELDELNESGLDLSEYVSEFLTGKAEALTDR